MNLLILTGIFPPKVGGPATYVPRIARSLKNQGWSIEIITVGLDKAEESFPYPVHRVPAGKWKRIPRAIKRITNRSKWADRIYVNGMEFENFLSRVFSNTPFIEKIVGDRSWERYRNRQRGTLDIDSYQKSTPPFHSRMERLLQHRMAQKADCIVTPSRYLKQIVAQWDVDREQIEVIYNSAYPPRSIPDETVDWPGTGRKLLTVGRLVTWKRIPQLIQALDTTADDGLIVLGDGPEMNSCRETVHALGLDGRVSLKGSVPKAVVWQYLKQSDLLVLNSTYEGFPHILLEAMATGTPVYAAGSGGSKELAEFFPQRIKTYPPRQDDVLCSLLDGKYPARFDPPRFPKPLRWETIVEQTDRLLKESGPQ